MHDIEPHFKWRNEYDSTRDPLSPYYRKVHSEFSFSHKVYNYFIHPQWDEFGSSTLYLKILFTDYDEGYAILELIGEWNDAINNDIMFLKREIMDLLIGEGINKFILICENVLNFHGSDDCYYEEWYEDIQDEGGWICLINTLEHVEQEMQDHQINYFVNFGHPLNQFNWRPHRPKMVFKMVNDFLDMGIKNLKEAGRE